ncbi:MAG: hypothetical protein HY914_21855 [Desulfomonile tiedjei]|nr:hypothetical protein [Desulfomonile tiedjei]
MIRRLLFVISVFAGVAIALGSRYVNEDLFGAFAAGSDIYRGLLTQPDHWSFTAEGKIWVNQAWLSHLLLYLSHTYFGPAGPVAIKVLLFVGSIALVLFRSRSLDISWNVCLVTLLGGVLATGPFLGLRQENFGLFFFLGLTTLLTRTDLPRSARYLGIAAVLTVWSNCHGSALLGLGLVFVKGILTAGRAVLGDRKEGAGRGGCLEAAEWSLVGIVSAVLIAVANPFGLENLLMPFTQVGTKTITGHSADWLPLLSFQQIDEGLFAAGSPYPYLIFLGAIFLSIVAVLLVNPYALRERFVGPNHREADLLMEAVVAALTVVLAFRFGRLALFSALSLVPFASVVFSLLFRSVAPASLHPSKAGRYQTAGAVLLTGTMVFLCYRVAVIPYLPGNPFRPPRPVMRELMSFDSFSPALVDFMRNNHLTDRVLSGWGLAPYLMANLPEIRLFMDTRDQSYYPAEIARDYFIIMGILPGTQADAQALLDRYGVATIALTTGPIDFALAVRLMRTGKWVCLYTDPDSILLVREDSSRFREMIHNRDLGSLWFPDSTARTLSEAVLWYFTSGRIPANLVQALTERVAKAPWPNYYSLISAGANNPNACFRPETVKFLTAEAARLSETDPRYSSGAEQVLQSLVQIYELLEANAAKCGEPQRARQFRESRIECQSTYDRLRRYYLGALF